MAESDYPKYVEVPSKSGGVPSRASWGAVLHLPPAPAQWGARAPEAGWQSVVAPGPVRMADEVTFNPKTVPGWLALGLVMMLSVVSCAHQPPVSSLALLGEYPGFAASFAHGFLAPFAFIVSLVRDVTIYAWPNNGTMYNFGFVTGQGALMLAVYATVRR